MVAGKIVYTDSSAEIYLLKIKLSYGQLQVGFNMVAPKNILFLQISLIDLLKRTVSPSY